MICDRCQETITEENPGGVYISEFVESKKEHTTVSIKAVVNLCIFCQNEFYDFVEEKGGDVKAQRITVHDIGYAD